MSEWGGVILGTPDTGGIQVNVILVSVPEKFGSQGIECLAPGWEAMLEPSSQQGQTVLFRSGQS